MTTAVLKTNPEHFLWTEAYRPDFEGVIIPPDLKDRLRKFMDGGKIPSFIFYSPSPGTGKTTTARAMAAYMNSEPLFINASTENSIDTIRTLVVQYATTSNIFGDGMKVVILDEADRLSPAAQDGLKGVMEAVSHNCAFILTCNNKGRIIEALRSRATEVDFMYTTEQQIQLSTLMLKRLMTILQELNIEFDVKALAALTKRYAPDNRKLLQMTQHYARLNGKIDSGILAEADSKDIANLFAALKSKVYPDMLRWCTNNADSIGDDFYRILYNLISPKVDDNSHAQLILLLNDYQRYHSVVPDRFLHLSALCTNIMMEVNIK